MAGIELKHRLAILDFNPRTKELRGVSLVDPKLTPAEAQKICDDLAPDDKTLIRNRVALLTWKED